MSGWKVGNINFRFIKHLIVEVSILMCKLPSLHARDIIQTKHVVFFYQLIPFDRKREVTLTDYVYTELQITKVNFINNVYCQHCILSLMDLNSKFSLDVKEV